jgi:hypothetical protein
LQISHLEALPDRAIEDDQSIELLKSYLKGGTKERKGTLQEYMAKMGAKENASKSQYFMICMQFQIIVQQNHFDFRSTQSLSVFVRLQAYTNSSSNISKVSGQLNLISTQTQPSSSHHMVYVFLEL